MAYTKIVFQNSPSTATPLNAENLNHMDDQIALNDQRLTEIETSYVKSFNGRKGEVVPENGDYNIGQIAPLTGAQVGQVPVVVNHGTEQDPELVFEMGAGGGGGHSIIDSEGNTMPQESAMQFKGMTVTDDATNGKTVVEATKTSVGLGNVPNVTTDNQTPTVTEASTRANLATGDTLKTIIGKIKKFFTDLKAVAFSGSASDVDYSNSQSGMSATKVQGAIDELSSAVGTQGVITTITPPATSALTSSGGIFYIRKGNNAILVLNGVAVASAGNNQYLFSIPDTSISNMLVAAGGLGSKTNGVIFVGGKDVCLSNSESDNPSMTIYATVNLILQ